MHQLYTGKESGKTTMGNHYAILQDSPVSFHITVAVGDNLIYEHLERPSSIDEVRNKINELELELINKNQTQNNT
jgi:hypothetical protein